MKSRFDFFNTSNICSKFNVSKKSQNKLKFAEGVGPNIFLLGPNIYLGFTKLTLGSNEGCFMSLNVR
jgi:hypothetical protein